MWLRNIISRLIRKLTEDFLVVLFLMAICIGVPLLFGGLIVLIVSTVDPQTMLGTDLDENCHPVGLFKRDEARRNPESFWSKQILAIPIGVDNAIKNSKINAIEQKTRIALVMKENEETKVESKNRLDALRQTLKIQRNPKPLEEANQKQIELIEQAIKLSDDVFAKVLADMDGGSELSQQKYFAETIKWGQSCTEYAKQQLTKAKR